MTPGAHSELVGSAARRSRTGSARARGAVAKRYDADYFERWYRRSKVGVGQRAFLDRKVRLALAAAEFVLGRPARSALDIGCGEAPWRARLKRMRPGLEYRGFDPSEYVVARYGRMRGITRAGLGELDERLPRGRYDLVICADVLHYVATPEVRAGLAAIAPRVGGVAFVETFTRDDEIEGDRVQFQPRTAAAYLRLFAAAGLVPLGLHLYVRRETHAHLVELERGAAGARS